MYRELCITSDFISERERTCTLRSLFAVARPSACRLSVTLVRPTQAVEIFGNILRHLYPGHPVTSTENFMEIVLGVHLRRGS